MSLGKLADGRDCEVIQGNRNDIKSQWSLFIYLFIAALDESLSEYEQHRSTIDIEITENLTIRWQNAVRALQNVSYLVSQTNKEMARNFQLMFWDCHHRCEGLNFQVEQHVHKLPFCH